MPLQNPQTHFSIQVAPSTGQIIGVKTILSDSNVACLIVDISTRMCPAEAARQLAVLAHQLLRVSACTCGNQGATDKQWSKIASATVGAVVN